MKRLLLVALCSAACVTTAQEGEQMRQDIAALRADLKKEMDATAADRQKDQRRDQGQTTKARELFQDFLTRYPKDELAANAQYWLGETFYAEKKWNDAIVEFQRVLKEHKGSDKVPDALLKIGMSFQAQGDCQNALLFFDEVAQAHKTAPAAKTAHDRSAECKRKNNQSRKR